MERLTDEERREIQVATADRDVRFKALRIIDAQAAAIEQVRAGAAGVADRDDCPHSINYALSEVFERALADTPEHTAPDDASDDFKARLRALERVVELDDKLTAANARIAELEKLNAAANAQADLFAERANAANARAEAAERALLVVSDAREVAEDKRERAESEAASLRRQRDSLMRDIVHADKLGASLRVSLEATENNYHELTLEAASLRAKLSEKHCSWVPETEAASLRAEVERLRRMVTVSDTSVLNANELRASLAAATALLENWVQLSNAPGEDAKLYDCVRAESRTFLSSAPAPSASAELECSYAGRCNSSRCPKHGQGNESAAAELKVLEAALAYASADMPSDGTKKALLDACRVELRRAVRK